jgi:hypothetical protein
MNYTTVTTTAAALRAALNGPGSVTTEALAAALGTSSARTLPVKRSLVRNALKGLAGSDTLTVKIALDDDPTQDQLRRVAGESRDAFALRKDRHRLANAGLYETIHVTAADREFRLFGYHKP